MDQQMVHERIKTYQKKQHTRMIIALIPSVLIILSGMYWWLKLPLALLVFLVIAVGSTIHLTNTYIRRILYNDLQPQLFYAVWHGTNQANQWALEDIEVAYLLGDYKAVVNICHQKLKDPKYKAQEHSYRLYLARVYFDSGAFEELRAICEWFENAFCEQKGGKVLKKTCGHVIRYYNRFMAGDFEQCRAVYGAMLKDPVSRKQALAAIRVRYMYAVACYKAGDSDEAAVHFQTIAEEAPELHYAALSKDYLYALAADTAYVPKQTIPAADETYTAPTVAVPETKKPSKVGAVIVSLCAAVMLLGSFAGEFYVKPTSPLEAIVQEQGKVAVLERVKVTEDGDALCLFETEYGQLGVAYLDHKGEERYVYRVGLVGAENGGICRIQAADSSLRIYCAIYADEQAIPVDAQQIVPFSYDGKTHYFTIVSVETKWSLGYSAVWT